MAAVPSEDYHLVLASWQFLMAVERRKKKEPTEHWLLINANVPVSASSLSSKTPPVSGVTLLLRILQRLHGDLRRANIFENNPSTSITPLSFIFVNAITVKVIAKKNI